MGIIKLLKQVFVKQHNFVEEQKNSMSSGVQQKNKVYYDLLNQRIKRKQDNLLKLQHAVKEMQNSLEHNETDASHDANILALNAMMEIEENRTIGY